MSRFRSIFAELLASYVRLRRELGLRFENQEAMLIAFDRYLQERDYQGSLSEQLAREFATSAPERSMTVPARRYLVVRHFAEYLAIHDPSTPTFDPRAIFRSHRQPPPYIFTDEELEQLLRLAMEVPQRPVTANLALRTMIGLAASSGLRLREVISLDHCDVDLENELILVRRSKLDKDRLVPVHPSTCEALRVYTASREQAAPAVEEAAFFLNARMRRYAGNNVDYLFRKLVRRCDLHSRPGRMPTFHALRHTFAVNRLLSWYRAGASVQALLPALATYMGHVHYTSTSYYLTATAELLGVAADRLAAAEARHD